MNTNESSWKPSDGQLECLEYAINNAEKDYSPLAGNRIYLTLKALKKQLEKIKNENIVMEDYKEKYNKLVEAIKVLQEANPSNKGIQNWINAKVPELAESEDEKIRKDLISLLNSSINGKKVFSINDTTRKQMLAWLEKQGTVDEIVKRCKDSWYNEGKIAGQAEGLTNDERYWQGWHDALEKQGDKDKLIQELGKYKVKYTQDVLEKHINSMSNKDDERLRKTTIAFLKDFAEQGYENAVECIDWLEKQGVQKPFDYENVNIPQRDFEPKSAMEAIKEEKINNQNCVNPIDKVDLKYKVGDWIVDKSGLVQQVLNFRGGIYTCTYNSFTIDCESNYHLWTIKDAKDGDILCVYNNIFIFKEYINWEYKVYSYCELFNEEKIASDHCAYICSGDEETLMPATKEQQKLLFEKLAEAGYTWDAEKKVLNKIKMQNLVTSETNVTKISDQDNKWSEEDEDILKWSLHNLEEIQHRFGSDYGIVGKCINWLKSIKNRVQPQQKQEEVTKKSDKGDQDKWNNEDIRMLNTVINIFEKVYPSNYFTTFTTGSENPMLINSPEIVKWLKGIKQKALGKLKLTKEDLEALRIAIINLGDMAEVDVINNFNMTFGEAKEKLIEIKDRYAE